VSPGTDVRPPSAAPGPADQQALLERQREHFNAIAETYRRARSGANHLLLKRLMWSHFFRFLPPLAAPGRPVRVLEAMCGYGDGEGILRRHACANLEYHGYDYSDQVVSGINASRPDLKIVQADATTYAATPGAYDVIMLLGGLHHVPDQAPRVVENLAPGLRPGGVFINLEPTHGNPITQAVRGRIYARNTLFDEKTERAFAVAELEAMFTRAGLRPLEMQHPGLLSYVLYYNPDAFPRLNLGGQRCVRAAFALDRPLLRSRLGRWLSFATLSAWRRP
jgi:SAM-dependent methyltransferase